MTYTAEELINIRNPTQVGEKQEDFTGTIKLLMVEFAKLHVQAALQEASKKVHLSDELDENFGRVNKIISPNLIGRERKIIVNKNSILNSYPDSNIK